MSRIENTTRAFGAPSRYIQGRYELNNLRSYADSFGSKLLIVIDTFFYEEYSKKFEEMYREGGSEVRTLEFSGEIYAEKIDDFADQVRDFSPNVVAGMGGGKTMDTAKALADIFHAATIVIPTTASTDAPCIGLSVLYTKEGEHVGARHYIKNPDLVLLDTEILVQAPIRFLSAGMGDALSTYIETRANLASSSPNYVWSGFASTLAVEALAKTCHQTVLTKGVSAYYAAKNHLCTKDFEDVVEANTLLSGLGVQNSSCAGAHSIAEGLEIIPECRKLLHGEAVAFGNLVQLVMEGRDSKEIQQIYDLYKIVHLPMTFKDLGIENISEEDIMKIARESLKSYWDVEPFPVTEQMVFDCMKMANYLGTR
jgi:glycerol dehydrogenase